MLLLYAVQKKIETHLKREPEHKGKQQEQTCFHNARYTTREGLFSVTTLPLNTGSNSRLL